VQLDRVAGPRQCEPGELLVEPVGEELLRLAGAAASLDERVEEGVGLDQVEHVDRSGSQVRIPRPRAAAGEDRDALPLDALLGEHPADDGDPVQKLEADLAEERADEHLTARPGAAAERRLAPSPDELTPRGADERPRRAGAREAEESAPGGRAGRPRHAQRGAAA